MKNSTRIFLIVLIVILMAAVIAAFTYCTVNKYAHAEFADITNDSMVNFNQLISIPAKNISSTVSANYYDSITPISYKAGDKVYIKTNNTNYHKIALGSANAPYQYIENDFIFNYTGNLTFNSIIYYSGLPAGNYFFNWINLTKMFGSGNEPSIEKCRELFTAEYYNYTIGTAMFYGIGDFQLQQEINVPLNSGNLTGYTYNITNTDVTYDSNGALVLSGRASENYAAYYLINLKMNVPVGSIVTLSFNSYITSLSTGIVYADNQESYIGNLPISSAQNRPAIISFVADHDFSALYLILDNYTINGTLMTIYDSNINIKLAEDYGLQYELQYDKGYYDAVEYYTDGYGRQEIWTSGFTAGKAQGLIEANGSFTAMDYVKSAFVTIGDILMIEVFPNFTLGAFFLLPLITSAIFFIVKITKGG